MALSRTCRLRQHDAGPQPQHDAPPPQVGVLARDLVHGRGFVRGSVERPVTFDVLGVGGGGSEAQLLGQLVNLLVAIKQVPSLP